MTTSNLYKLVHTINNSHEVRQLALKGWLKENDNYHLQPRRYSNHS